jgi:PAS domain-containing protein
MLQPRRSRLVLAIGTVALFAAAMTSAVFRAASLSRFAALLQRNASVTLLLAALLGGAALAAAAAFWRSAHRRTAELEKLRGQLELERSRVEAVLRLLPAGVLFADRSGKILHANDEARRIWAGRSRIVPPTTYRACRARRFDTGAALPAGEWGVTRVLRTGAVSPREHLEIDRFDGTRGEVLASSAPVRDREGTVVGAVAVLEDVLALRATVARAARARPAAPAEPSPGPPPEASGHLGGVHGSSAGSTGTREAAVAVAPGRWPSRLP